MQTKLFRLVYRVCWTGQNIKRCWDLNQNQNLKPEPPGLMGHKPPHKQRQGFVAFPLPFRSPSGFSFFTLRDLFLCHCGQPESTTVDTNSKALHWVGLFLFAVRFDYISFKRMPFTSLSSIPKYLIVIEGDEWPNLLHSMSNPTPKCTR